MKTGPEIHASEPVSVRLLTQAGTPVQGENTRPFPEKNKSCVVGSLRPSEGLLMTEWQPISAAKADEDVIILDNHNFVYRARLVKPPFEGWKLYGQRVPTFVSHELQGWIPLPAFSGKLGMP